MATDDEIQFDYAEEAEAGSDTSSSTDGGIEDPQDSEDYEDSDDEDAGQGATRCAACASEIDGSFYRTGTATICGPCAEQVRAEAAPAGGGFFKAALLGVAAAFGCSLVWYAILAITGYELGLLAIAVGFGVGFAVQFGSGGRGGPVYQAMAIALAYASITLTYVPLIAEELRNPVVEVELTEEQLAAQQGVPEVGDGTTATEGSIPPPSSPTAVPPPSQNANGEYDNSAEPVPWIVAVVVAIPIALLVPFLEIDVIGLFIIAIALYQAWKMTKRRKSVALAGPFELDPEPAEAEEA